MECLTQFLKNPATRLNDLNKIAPQIISQKDFSAFGKVVKALLAHDIVSK
jgi:hypothetical protein